MPILKINIFLLFHKSWWPSGIDGEPVLPPNPSIKEWTLNFWCLDLKCGRSLAASGYIIDLSGMELTRIDLLPREDLIHMLKHDIICGEELQWIF